jgi:predicted metal-dependent hydrolase
MAFQPDLFCSEDAEDPLPGADVNVAPGHLVPPEMVRDIYAETFRRLDAEARTPSSIHVAYYPYIGINHTIRVRNSEVYVRIAEMCSDMPVDAHRALSVILVSKLLRRKVPKTVDRIYSEYANSDAVRDRASTSKRTRGRKVITSSKGDVYDLDEIFDVMNVRYFRGVIPKPVLTWSAKKTYRILGHHDAHHDHIAISRSLDSIDVPRFVVEYVIFHEMLHIAHPTKHINGRRHNHTPAFRRDEKKFAHYDRAESWIERNVGRLKLAARRS